MFLFIRLISDRYEREAKVQESALAEARKKAEKEKKYGKTKHKGNIYMPNAKRQLGSRK